MTIEKRLEVLERQNYWMKRALLGLIVICVAVVFMGAAQTSNEIKTKALYILDDKGRMAVKIHARNGLGSVSFWDANLKKQKPQITIGCIGQDNRGGGGTQIFMKNGKGERAINLVAQKKGRVHTW